LINRDSKIIRAYLASGRPLEYLEQALASVTPLDDYQIELLQTGRIEVEKSRKCLEWTKAILKDAKFNEIVAGAKADELEGRKARKNPTARLIHRLMEAVGAPVGQPKAILARN
jgi:hypothetical protein